MFRWGRFLIIVLISVFFLMPVSEVFSAQIHVPGGYPTIQDGVDAAVDGDIIIVADGSYVENVQVDKSVEIRSENGAENTSVQGEEPGHHVFLISANQVTIEGFTISGALISDAAAIYISSGYGQCALRNNQIGTPSSANLHGIILADSHDNFIGGNTITENTGNGITMMRSSGNTVKGNTILHNGRYGIDCSMAVGNHFIENVIKAHANGSSYGILFHVSSDNLVFKNTFSDNYMDVRMRYSSHNNQIVENTCENSSFHSIQIDHDSQNNQISKNELNSSSYGRGIHLWSVGVNEVSGNVVSGHDAGVSLQGATDCLVSGNVCNGNKYSGLYVDSHSDRNKINVNQCNNNDRYGIIVFSSSLNEVSFNQCSENESAGLALMAAQNNVFFRNTVHTNGYGISVMASSLNNRVFLNSFADNDTSVFSQTSETFWQDEDPVSYVFQGTVHEGFLGNYYSDHDLTDSDGNGVTDLPKDQPDIDLDDNFPLSMGHTIFKTPSSDVDFDGHTDGRDLAGFITAFVTENMTADLNKDTVFDQLDIEAFALMLGG